MACQGKDRQQCQRTQIKTDSWEDGHKECENAGFGEGKHMASATTAAQESYRHAVHLLPRQRGLSGSAVEVITSNSPLQLSRISCLFTMRALLLFCTVTYITTVL